MGTTFAELYARRAELTALADEADRVIAQARALGLDTDADPEVVRRRCLALAARL